MSGDSTEIMLGVSGGIAAYKSVELLRQLQKRGLSPRVSMTEGAQKFVTPLLFAAISGRPVLTDVWQMSADGGVEHVRVGRGLRLLILAPATAELLARLYAGNASDALGALVSVSDCPVLVAPAMETNMWRNAATQRNVQWLKATGRFHFIGPEAGALASGESGMGRMSEPEVIADAALGLLNPGDWAGRTLLVSAGPTREAIDPVRFLTNRSSGKMGFALAERAAARGAKVVLISGPVHLPTPSRVERIDVESAEQMLAALSAAMPAAQALIMAAAVSDYAPAERSSKKLKKAVLGSTPTLALKQTPDLVRTLAQNKGQRVIVGFAAETNDTFANAAKKLATKGLDFIVANDVSQEGIGFDSDENAVTLLDANGLIRELPRASKSTLADAILDETLRRLPS